MRYWLQMAYFVKNVGFPPGKWTGKSDSFAPKDGREENEVWSWIKVEIIVILFEFTNDKLTCWAAEMNPPSNDRFFHLSEAIWHEHLVIPTDQFRPLKCFIKTIIKQMNKLFSEIFQNWQNWRILHVCSFPRPYYMWKSAKKWRATQKLKNRHKNYIGRHPKPYIDFITFFYWSSFNLHPFKKHL